ncbi:MAG: TadE family protein [Planctomycetota bacterium]
MAIHLRRRDSRRSAAAMVELAAVVAVFVMFLFGVMEYCRFVWVRNMVTFAAREGCRYCVVHTDATDPEGDTKTYVGTKLGNLAKYANYNCKVYWSDSSGSNLGLVYYAQFGQLIAVEVALDYQPIVPTLLFMNKSYTLKSRCMMNSEAN